MSDSSSSSTFQPAGGTAICTLFEGDYHLGLAALVNSLVRAGYAGTVWAGYRGALPPWLKQLRRLDAPGEEYAVAEQVRLAFLPLHTEIHFTHYKPRFMLDLFAGPAGDCEYLWYLDPDIFVRCNWTFFADWQQNGIALCQEITNNILPADSPLRQKWVRIAGKIGLDHPRPLNHYFSAGLVGVSAQYTSFLEDWWKILGLAEAEGIDLNRFMPGNRESALYAPDQDGLNIAAMYTEYPLTTMGPEAMGFVPGGFTVYHAVGPKPWRASFLKRSLAGMPPSGADKFYFTQVSYPIRVYSPVRLHMKRLACSMAALAGRFYGRQ